MKKQIGFTLIELMVSLAVIAITLSVAVPGFQSLVERKSIQSIAPLFERSIKYARSEAVQRGQTLQILPSTKGSDWATGWVVQSVAVDGTVTIIRNFEGLPASINFESDDFDTTTPLSLLSTGEADESGGSFTLNYIGCTGIQVINYEVLISGQLKKSLSKCP